MPRRSGRTAAKLFSIALAVVAAGACAAERAAPVATRPPPPSTTSTVPSPSSEPDPAPPEPSTTTTAPASPTTAPASPTTTVDRDVTPAAWRTFDFVLASRLLGSGDFAAGVAVAVNGRLVHTGSFGYRIPPRPMLQGGTTGLGTNVPRQPPEALEPADRFRIGSISKVLTAVVVLQLVEAGELRMDQQVGGLLASHVEVDRVDPAMASITVRQLLSHTSGLPEQDAAFFGGAVDSCAGAARSGFAGGMAAPPGKRYLYSNLNFCLLGLLVEAVTNRPYEVVVREQLLEPLGIKGMRMADTVDRTPGNVFHPSVPTRNYMEVLAAAGAWVASPVDVVRILDALDPDKPGWHPLSARTLDLMRKPLPKVPYRRDDRWYGLGMIVSVDGTWGHTGTVENAHAMVLARPDGVTWSLLVSGEYPWETDDLRGIFDEAAAAADLRFN